MFYQEEGATIPVKSYTTVTKWVLRDGKLVGLVGKRVADEQ